MSAQVLCKCKIAPASMKIYEMRLNGVQKEVVREAVSLWKEVTRGNIEAAFEKLPLDPEHDPEKYSSLLEFIHSTLPEVIPGGHTARKLPKLPHFRDIPFSHDVTGYGLFTEEMQGIAEATEMLTRVQMGQIRFAFEWMLREPEGNWKLYHSMLDEMHSRLPHLLLGGIDGWRSSLGIGHRDLPPSNSVACDIWQTIRFHLSWQDAIDRGWVESMDSPRDWGKMLGVNYDKPFGWGREPLPEIALVYGACSSRKTEVLQ